MSCRFTGSLQADHSLSVADHWRHMLCFGPIEDPNAWLKPKKHEKYLFFVTGLHSLQ